MKKTFKSFALILVAGGLLGSAKAQLASPDIFLGFRAQSGTGSAISTVIDLGTAASIASEGSFTLNLSATNSILSTIYGTNWFTLNTLNWGILGSDDSTVNAWIGRQTGTASSAISTAGLATINGNYDGMLGAQGTGNASLGSVNDSKSISHITSTVGSAVSGAWVIGVNTAGNPSPQGWGYFSSAADNVVTLGITAASYSSDFNGTGLGFTPVDLFTLANNAGVITITAVPEPSTYALAGLGVLVLLIVSRRKHSA